MNMAQTDIQFEIEAKTCDCKEKRNVIYSFVDPYHTLCLDKKEIILAQIQTCERLLKYAKDANDKIKTAFTLRQAEA